MSPAQEIRLRTIGDNLQSEASRLVEWVRNNVAFEELPYEVGMALLGVEQSIDAWTEERKTTRVAS